MSAVIDSHSDDHHHGPAKGITRWLYTTNHKDIGTLYLWFSFLMLFLGGAMAQTYRMEPKTNEGRKEGQARTRRG